MDVYVIAIIYYVIHNMCIYYVIHNMCISQHLRNQNEFVLNVISIFQSDNFSRLFLTEKPILS